MADGYRHFVFTNKDDIPYIHVQQLGSGSGGTVDEVYTENNGTRMVYARKTIKLPPTGRSLDAKRRAEVQIKAIKEEARIIRRLRHNHVVQVMATYETAYNNSPKFCIMLRPVANKDLGEYLKDVDAMGPEEKREAILEMRHWAGCLTRAMDYIHDRRVKHKDIKPANILVQGHQVYITDFGIAREFELDQSKTSGMTGTRVYNSPEALIGEPRGRASDVFSLGCCFLEMATVMITNGELYTLKSLREGPFGENPDAVLQWIYYLFSILAQKARQMRALEALGRSVQDDLSLVLQHAALLPPLVFVMMDPDPDTRASSRQLKALIGTWDRDLFCPSCRRGVGADEDPIMGLHSKFKDRAEMNYPDDPARALKEPVAKDWRPPTGPIVDDGQIVSKTRWEAAKRLWLKKHMWW